MEMGPSYYGRGDSRDNYLVVPINPLPAVPVHMRVFFACPSRYERIYGIRFTYLPLSSCGPTCTFLIVYILNKASLHGKHSSLFS